MPASTSTMRTARKSIPWLVLIVALGYWCMTNLHVRGPKTLAVGWGGRLQENTLEAVRQVVALGLKSVEIDVQVTRDGVAIGLHDEMLDRETNGSGPVSAQMWREISALKRKDGNPINRLDEIFSILSEGDIERVFLDVRESDPASLVPVFEPLVFPEEALTFLVFSDRQLVAYRRYFPSSEIVFKSYRLPSEWREEGIGLLREKGYDGVGFPIDSKFPTRAFMKNLRKRGLKSFVFVVKTRQQFNELQRLSIDYAVVAGIWDRAGIDFNPAFFR